jgi:hypothetical protein
VAFDPGVDRLDLSRAELDGQYGLGFRIRHIHRLMRRCDLVKRIAPSVRRSPAAKPGS